MKLDDNYSPQYQELIDKLRAARAEAGLTQDEVAKRLGRSQSFVSRSETGERRVDPIELKAFASIYQKSIAYFVSDRDSES